jgi:hypothetical protein
MLSIHIIVMKNNRIVILLVILILILLIYIGQCNTKVMYEPYVVVKPSLLLDNDERGLFATKDYNEGDTIEVCPTLIMVKDDIPADNIIHEHLFKGSKKGNHLLSLGYCSIINHSKDKQNCTWQISHDDRYITAVAITDIKKGDELYSNYGNDYWESRDYKQL